MKWKLARLSAALAFLTLSTEDYTKVTVTKEHVNLVAKFIQEEYSKRIQQEEYRIKHFSPN
jgi:predicted transcriptional regulator YdeE